MDMCDQNVKVVKVTALSIITDHKVIELAGKKAVHLYYHW
jgi:hypothetical protein